MTVLLSWSYRADSGDPDLIYSVDFSDYAAGAVMTWLGSKGFVPEQDMKEQRRIALTGSDKELTLQAKSRSLGLLVDEVNIAGASRIRIDWGVQSFPPGASYEQGIRSDAVMVYIFFGSKKNLQRVLAHPRQSVFPRLVPVRVGSDRVSIHRSLFQARRQVCLRGSNHSR